MTGGTLYLLNLHVNGPSYQQVSCKKGKAGTKSVCENVGRPGSDRALPGSTLAFLRQDPHRPILHKCTKNSDAGVTLPSYNWQVRVPTEFVGVRKTGGKPTS